MNFQIDVKPMSNMPAAQQVNLYIDGACYPLLAVDSWKTVEALLLAGLIHQVRGTRHNEKQELEKFDYPDGVDSAGVKYTSANYSLTKIQE